MTSTTKIALIVGGVVVAAGVGYLVYNNLKSKSEPQGTGEGSNETPNTNFSDLPQGGEGPVRAPITSWLDLKPLTDSGGKGVQFDAAGPLSADSKYKEFLPK